MKIGEEIGVFGLGLLGARICGFVVYDG